MKRIILFPLRVGFTALLILIFTQNIRAQVDTVCVLFLGNSFTAVNDLPGTFEQLATKAGKIVYVEENSPGGYTLSGHAQNFTSLQKINSRKWDFVVLQDQSQIPSMIPDRDTLMYPYAIILDSLIHQSSSCTQTCFFMTWAHKNGDLGLPVGSDSYEAMQQRLRSGYMTIADSLDALVAPVGWAWRYVRQNYSSINLYSSDDYHPEMSGTYLAACVFYATIFEQTPFGIGYDAGLDPSIVQDLQFVAGKIVMDSLPLWNHGVYNPMPIISFNIDTVSAANEIQFHSFTNLTDSIYWDFGDGNTSVAANPLHTYQNSGVYIAKVVGKNECGTDTFSSAINISINGISANENQNTIRVFPNPTGGSVHFQFAEGKMPETISVVTILGNRLLYEPINITDNEKTIDLSPYERGIYFLKLNFQNGKQEMVKIIKQ